VRAIPSLVAVEVRVTVLEHLTTPFALADDGARQALIFMTGSGLARSGRAWRHDSEIVMSPPPLDTLITFLAPGVEGRALTVPPSALAVTM
jgi:hypothetical protein